VLDMDSLTPFEQMNAGFAKKVTGGDELDEVQKKQIREQQRVRTSPVLPLRSQCSTHPSITHLVVVKKNARTLPGEKQSPPISA
jgi:hypothetical protein